MAPLSGSLQEAVLVVAIPKPVEREEQRKWRGSNYLTKSDMNVVLISSAHISLMKTYLYAPI